MIARKSYRQAWLGLSLLLASCSDDAGSERTPVERACDQDEVGRECECRDGAQGLTDCNESDLIECHCEAARPDASRPTDANTPRRDGSTPADPDASERVDASLRTDAGRPGGEDPKIPAIAGECPQFASGTMTIGGLANITVEVGARKSGGALLFYWHGTGSVAAEYKGLLPPAVRKEILDEGGMIISPQDSTNKGADCSGTAIFKQGDFEITDLIAACAVEEQGIDPRRIYTTGCSAGGLQAACMAARRSSYVAAAVPNSGGFVFPQAFEDEARIPALMTMHGGARDFVRVAFSETSQRADMAFKSAGGFVVNCNHGGDHCAAPAELQSAAWAFMKAHPFGVDPRPYGSELPRSFPSYCSVY
jgi:hypothetical protein